MSTPDPVVFALSRVTGVAANPTTIEQRSNAFATSAEDCDLASLVMTRDASGVRTYLVLDGPDVSVQSAAISLAHAVGARAEQVDSFPAHLREVPALARMLVSHSSSVARQSIMGTDPTEIARLLASHLRVGDWVAVSLRKPLDKETRRNEEWIGARLSGGAVAHHSQARDARAVSFWAGSSDARSARGLLKSTASAMQGFDLKVKAESVTPWRGARGWFAAAVLTGAGAVSTRFVPQVPALAMSALAGLAGLLVVVGALRLIGKLPTLSHRTRRLVAVGLLPDPPRRSGRPRAPRESREDRETGRKTKADPGQYPLHDASFLVQPSIFVGLASPHAGTDAGATSTQRRSVPIPMTNRIGPLVGFDDEVPAYLSNAAASAGVAIVGRPNSGKSVLTRAHFGWSCMERTHASGIPHATGANSTLIAFESKDHIAVREYQAWADATGDKLVVVELGDPAAFGIDLFATPGNVGQRADAFVNAMVYAFGTGDIQNRSFDVLKRIYTAALAVDEHRDLLDTMDWIDGKTASINHFADVLIGNHGDPRAVQLAREIISRSRVPELWSPSLVMAAEALAPLFESRTEAQRRSMVEAAQNKVSQFASMEHWWSPVKKKVTWDQVLATTPRHRSVVINAGASLSGQPVEDRMTELMSSLIMFTLQRAIRRICVGWEGDGRSVSIYSDELSLLAGTTPEIILWLKDQGRSFGVRPILATQRPAQLPKEVRALILNFGTLICFNQDAVATAEEVAREMSGADGPIEANEIMHLPDFHAMVRAYVGKERQPAFTVKAFNFEADRNKAIEMQGYPVTGVVVTNPIELPEVAQSTYEAAHPTPPQIVEAPVLADPIPAPIPVAYATDDDGYDEDLLGGTQ